jgi:hypothetical protein
MFFCCCDRGEFTAAYIAFHALFVFATAQIVGKCYEIDCKSPHLKQCNMHTKLYTHISKIRPSKAISKEAIIKELIIAA